MTRQPDSLSPFARTLSRRQALASASAGFGSLALAGLLGQTAAAATPAATRVDGPLAPKTPHFPVKAKRVIFLFMQGAMSQMDTWEYKAQLQKDGGKVGPGGGMLTASKFKFAQHGDTGTWVSELFPHTAKLVDKLCFIRGLHTDTPAHPQAVIQLHTGAAIASLTRPSLGAWLMYGLGTENQDLPGYVTINPPPNFGGAINFGSAFLPARFQGTKIADTGYVPNLKPGVASSLQRKQLDLLQAMNRDLGATPEAPDQLDGVIESFELAFKMQDKVPELLDLSREPQTHARCVRREGRPRRQLRAAMPYGASVERSRRAFRRDLPSGLGSTQQPAQRAHPPTHRPPINRRPHCSRTWNNAACSKTRSCSSAASSAVCPRRKGRTDATTTSPAIRCGSRAPALRKASPTARRTSTARRPSKAACTRTTYTPRCWR